VGALGEGPRHSQLSVLDALYAQYPKLDPTNHRITSNPSRAYNCVAWIERDMDRWWEPDFFWPEHAPDPIGEEDVDCYVTLFEGLGFAQCADANFEPGFLKIAIYVEDNLFHHVAKQVPSGAWSSKAGPLHDLRHDTLELLEEVGIYANAKATIFMRRPHDYDLDPMTLEETGLLLP
jgi:hypothetical protein